MIKITREVRQMAAARLEEIACEMADLLQHARVAAETGGIWMSNADAYVFEQIAEHLENANPHNQSLGSLADELRKGQCEECGREADEMVSEQGVTICSLCYEDGEDSKGQRSA
jgi:hypothetical protein